MKKRITFTASVVLLVSAIFVPAGAGNSFEPAATFSSSSGDTIRIEPVTFREGVAFSWHETERSCERARKFRKYFRQTSADSCRHTIDHGKEWWVFTYRAD